MKLNQALQGLALTAWVAAAAAAPAQQSAAAPPPAAPPQRTAAELEKLLAPIALYPDPLIATILPASVYPLEIVQAARFVQDTNNLAILDDQPWDENVRAVARVPAAIKKLNDDLSWTMELGQAFLDQQKEVFDTVQSLRAKAQGMGTLQTTPQQVVVVTNTVIEKTVEQRVVYVTNTVVQIQPSNPQVVYVPTYNPYTVYYPPPPAYVGPPPVVTFAVGVTVGLIIANNCDWHGGGIYVGHHGVAVWGGGGGYGGNNNVNIDRSININGDVNINRGQQATPYAGASATSAPQKWQPDSSRLSKSGVPSSSASAQARGYSSRAPRPTSTASATARPAPSASRSSPSPGVSRSSPSPGVSGSAPSSSNKRPSPSPSASRSGGSAFGGMSSQSSAQSASSRGSFSRGGGGGRGGRR